MTTFSFKQVLELLKKEAKSDPKFLGILDKLLGFSLVCAPVVLGPAAVAALPTLTVKNELTKLGQWAFDKLTKKKDTDYLQRQERMQAAYSLLVFTSFFAALDQQIPESFRVQLDLTQEQQTQMLAGLTRKIVDKAASKELSTESAGSSPDRTLIVFPHPTEPFDSQIDRNVELWKAWSRGLQDAFAKLLLLNLLSDAERAELRASLDTLPKHAASNFEAQYFELAKRYEGFALWANLQEHKATKNRLDVLASYVRVHAALARDSAASLDIGFAGLRAAVEQIPEALKVSRSVELVESLTRHYAARATEPLFEDPEEPPVADARLTFPRLCDAFIPQEFRVLRKFGDTRRLEDETVWNDLPRRNDLNAFLLSFLSSPYSTEGPLLVLGHPGSGKSLLTKILAYQLMSTHYTVIRVSLREVNADANLISQIEETIRDITKSTDDSWARLRSAFKNSPPLIILDGYDELLQASGKVFAGYLKDVQDFQKSEAEQHRPVRVIVTSRVTLIDKATVPSGSTVIRLLEFSKRQRDKWIATWNDTNADYFQQTEITAFALPDENEDGAEKVLSLAVQPLLLLMLALYDSQDNQLRKNGSIDRTRLYDSLLRQFVKRERSKEKAFSNNSSSHIQQALDQEMQRLGIAALGMYNRRKVHMLARELNDDLAFFAAERPRPLSATGRTLSQAELLLGSFFFIHKAKARHGERLTAGSEELQAFEFLHNTFGEFLTADFILRRTLAETEALNALRDNPTLRDVFETRRSSADQFGREWFVGLIYTPLFSRPVILEMMREWIAHLLADRGLQRRLFVQALDEMVMTQVERLLARREMPSIMMTMTQDGFRAPFGDHPLLGHIAIYSMNLILLRLVVDDAPFVFDESKIATHEDGTRPWDRLAYIWRSWFALDNLNGVTAIMRAERDGPFVTLHIKEAFQVVESSDRLDICLSVALALGDNISSGLLGTLLFNPVTGDPLELEQLEQRLASEKLDLQLELVVKKLCLMDRLMVRGWRTGAGLDLDVAARAVVLAIHSDRLEQICFAIHRIVKRSVGQDWRDVYASRHLLHMIGAPSEIVEIARRSPRAALALWAAAREVGDGVWMDAFSDALGDFMELRGLELISRDPDSWEDWFELVRSVSSVHHRGPFWERFFEPSVLIPLTNSHPEAALLWLQLARDAGVRLQDNVRDLAEIADRASQQLLITLSDDSRLRRMLASNPRRVLDWLRLSKDTGSSQILVDLRGRILPQVFETIAGDWSRWNRQMSLEIVLNVMQLAGELGGPHHLGWLNLEGWIRDYLRHHAHPRELATAIESAPDAVVACFALIDQTRDDNQLREYATAVCDRIFESTALTRFLWANKPAFAAALRILRITQRQEHIDSIMNVIASALDPKTHGSMLNSLSITAIGDLIWAARQRPDCQMTAVLEDFAARSLE